MNHRLEIRSLGRAGLLLALTLVACRGSIEHYLLQASQGDSDSRREAIVSLGELLAEKEASGFEFDEGDREALEYIRDVAQRDPEAMNRMRAITSLSALRTVDSAEIFRDALTSEYWGVRWEAAKALRDHPRAADAELVARRLREEPRPEVLLDLVKTLAAIGGPEAERGLLDVYLDRTGRYRDNRLKAWEALVRISGQSFGYDEHRRWEAYRAERFGSGGASDLLPIPGSGEAP